MKKSVTLIILSLIALCSSAREIYVATNGDDSYPGTLEQPFASLQKAQSMVEAGDIVWIRGGEYIMTNDDIMGLKESLYHCVFLMDKSGSEGSPICYYGYPGERPVFNLAGVMPTDGRISVFYINGDYLHFRNFEIVNTRVVPASGNTQSECISNRGGSHNIYENLSMHDGQAIGFYLVKGGDNLVLNCDAYNNYENVTGSGNGGNVDGFGCHPAVGGTGNTLRGCRAWWNSDDGFDFIHSGEAVVIENCWAFYNGYKPGEFKSAGDGNGIKAGGYGMNENSKIPDIVPMHEVYNCIAYRNKMGGIYANHHLGGIKFVNNSSFYNRYNYNMVCRKSKEEPVDVDGYGHILINNVSYSPRESDITNIDYAKSTVTSNSFYPTQISLNDADFMSLDPSQLILPRKEDGSLPEVDFLRPTDKSSLTAKKLGYTFKYTPDEERPAATGWLLFPTILIEGDNAIIAGPGAEGFNKFYVNGVSVKIRKCVVDLSAYSGRLELRATSPQGGIIKLIITK